MEVGHIVKGNVSEYEIVKFLGQGCYGKVYLVEDKNSKEQ